MKADELIDDVIQLQWERGKHAAKSNEPTNHDLADQFTRATLSLKGYIAGLERDLADARRDLHDCHLSLNTALTERDEARRERGDARREVERKDKAITKALESIRKGDNFECWATSYPPHDLRDTLVAALVPPADAGEVTPTIVGREVISEPGASVRMEVLHLSEEAQRGLSVGKKAAENFTKETAIASSGGHRCAECLCSKCGQHHEPTWPCPSKAAG